MTLVKLDRGVAWLSPTEQRRSWLFWFTAFVAIGCGTVDDDRQALLPHCSLAERACAETCEESESCTDACDAGRSGCQEVLADEQPGHWETADAFYDGCLDNAENDLDADGCFVGQSTAARASAEILKKYGIVTVSP